MNTPSGMKRIGGKLYYAGGWKTRKVDAEKTAKYHRSWGSSVRITREHNPGMGNRIGYQIWIRGGN